MKEFDLKDYYNNTLTNKEDKQYFRALICKKFDVKLRTFNTWLDRGKSPIRYKNTIRDIVRYNKNLPTYK